MFEIKIFPGDPSRGNTGFMWSLRLSDGMYVKSAVPFPREGDAAYRAALIAVSIQSGRGVPAVLVDEVEGGEALVCPT